MADSRARVAVGCGRSTRALVLGGCAAHAEVAGATKPCPKGQRCRCDGRWQARITAPSGELITAPSTFTAKIDTEAWVKAKRQLMEDPATYVTADVRKERALARARADAANTFSVFAERYLTERQLRPTTLREYRRLLENVLLPTFGHAPMKQITRDDVRTWYGGLKQNTPSVNAAAYRLIRSIMAAAEDEVMIDRNPVRIARASTAAVKRVQRQAPVDDLAVIVEKMPDRLRLYIVLAAFVGLPEGELFELRRSDIDPALGSIEVTRKIEKDADPESPRDCRDCGRVIGPPKALSGRRTVHLPPAFAPLLRTHLLPHTPPALLGCSSPASARIT